MADPGWYLEPRDNTRERYWDGKAWAEQTRDAVTKIPYGLPPVPPPRIERLHTPPLKTFPNAQTRADGQVFISAAEKRRKKKQRESIGKVVSCLVVAGLILWAGIVGAHSHKSSSSSNYDAWKCSAWPAESPSKQLAAATYFGNELGDPHPDSDASTMVSLITTVCTNYGDKETPRDAARVSINSVYGS